MMKNKLLVIRVISVIIMAVGLIMLMSGIALSAVNKKQNSVADGAQMPEEYIEKYFSDENSEPSIEDYIEPKYDEANSH